MNLTLDNVLRHVGADLHNAANLRAISLKFVVCYLRSFACRSYSQRCPSPLDSRASKPFNTSTSQQAISSDGPVVEKPRLEADSRSFEEDEPDIKHEHVCSIANFSKKMKMPRFYGERWGNSGAGEVSGLAPGSLTLRCGVHLNVVDFIFSRT